MTHVESLEISRFLAIPDRDLREEEWERLIGRYSRLLLSVARSLGGNHDSAMDRYAYVLERLRENDFHRLRSFKPDGPSRFSTWLVVTARRLCVDHHRVQFGRASNGKADPDGVRQLRRRLALNDGEDLDISIIPDDRAPSPDERLDRDARSMVILRALAALSAHDRLLIQLRFHHGLSAAEIAQIMRLPTQFHVYRRLQTVLVHLKRTLGGSPVFDGDA